MTALGRQEEWEDCRQATLIGPYQWWKWHDSYGV
jgi:predicted dithiol-disulfide oxidoreductase (DUF899 family)